MHVLTYLLKFMRNHTLLQKFYLVVMGFLFLYHSTAVVISIKIVELDFQMMKKMVKFMSYMRLTTLMGMLLLIILIILYYLEVRKSRMKNQDLENDVQYLKSRLHELESGLNTEADKGEIQ